MRNLSLLLLLTVSVGLAHAAPLSFPAALDLVERQSPSLAAQQARIEAAQSSAINADSLPDPKLVIGVDNLPVNGPDRWDTNRDFMTMQKIGVMQDVPNGDKRAARAEAAQAGVEMSRAERRIESVKLRSETAQAWIRRYYVEQRINLFNAFDQENHLLAEAVRAQLASGRGMAADAMMPKQEAIQLADRRDDLERDLAKAKADLRRLIGMQGDEPLAGDPPPLDIDANTYRQHVHLHPELAAFASASQKAAAEEREAEAAKQSDWGVELAYQKRAPQYSNMVSVQFTFDLPLFTKTRQEPAIAAKQQELIRIDADRETMLRMHTAELDNDLADYAALSRQLERAKTASVPLAQEKVDLQSAGYRAGKGDLLSLLTARRELIEQRLKVIDLEQQRQIVAGKLYFSYGEGAQ